MLLDILVKSQPKLTREEVVSNLESWGYVVSDNRIYEFNVTALAFWEIVGMSDSMLKSGTKKPLDILRITI